MGGFSVPSYGQALLSLTDPLTSGAAETSVLSDVLSWSSILDPIYNAFGYVGPGQKSDLVSSETGALTQAGNSTAQASATASSDVTNALTNAGFDPSQATALSSFFSGLTTAVGWIIDGIALIALVWLLIEIAKFL